MSPYCNTLAIAERAAARAYARRLKRRADAEFGAALIMAVGAISGAYALGMLAGLWVSQ